MHSKFSGVVSRPIVHSLVVGREVFSNVSKTTDDDGGKAYAITPGRSVALEYWSSRLVL